MRNNKLNEFEVEAKTSGGAVFERGVKVSKENKAIRRIAQPLMDKARLSIKKMIEVK